MVRLRRWSPGPAWLLTAALGVGCTGGPEPADPGRVAEAAGFDVLRRAALSPMEGPVVRYDGYVVRPVSLQVFEGFRVSAALWLPDGPGPHPGVLVAHGHFGEGKSAGESQGPAHALARAGYAALAVDTPGVEEGDLPGRRIHFEAGAHGRALLASAGTSAMAAQLHGLVAGLDYLDGRPDVGPLAVIGASGGAVQALYLLFVDPRPVGAVLASYVPMPREARAGGCACDGLPGWPGPDPRLLAATPRPTLWLSELEQPPPEGLPRSATHRVLPGGHGYSDAMVAATLDWLSDRLGGGEAVEGPVPYTDPARLRSRSVGTARFADLLHPEDPPRWSPAPDLDAPYTVDCAGEGPRVILAGGEAADRAALEAAGFSACTLAVRADEVGLDEGLITQRPYVDRFAGALAAAAARERAVGVYAARAWGVAAEGAASLPEAPPYVLRDPLTRPQDVDPARDPAWVHAPGWWWREDPYAKAVVTGADPVALAARLAATPEAAAALTGREVTP
ncbi:MAG: hypothetical protein H6739_09540 [Alphaproteobacteria bacterium]|nr:hypothetical protein [Alphaproteobacteria bacterium]